MKDEQDGRLARAEMDAAKRDSEQAPRGGFLNGRYKLYDKIKERVSLAAVALVIAVTALLLIALLVIGILTAETPG